MDFSLWSSAFPGLLWEIEHKRSRISLLNNWNLPALGTDSARLLKDAHFRRKVVLGTDQVLVDEFFEMVLNRKSAMVSFRLECDPDAGCLLQGWPNPSDKGKYFGMLKESVLPAAFMLREKPVQLALGQSCPVLIFDLSQKRILSCNKAAADFFGISVRQGSTLAEVLNLEDMLPDNQGSELIEACQSVLASQQSEDSAMGRKEWSGTLILRNGAGNLVGCRLKITALEDAPEICRIALIQLADSLKTSVQGNQAPDIAGLELRPGMEKLFASCPGLGGLMFSDIQPVPGQVKVYGAGPLFSGLDWGSPHAYEGTIAQDIERYGLTSLTVEDTLDSIKSIDWAMFIPCGVRSYFAKPFFTEHRLHAVLIFAYADPMHENIRCEADFQALYEPFECLVARWRKREAGTEQRNDGCLI